MEKIKLTVGGLLIKAYVERQQGQYKWTYTCCGETGTVVTGSKWAAIGEIVFDVTRSVLDKFYGWALAHQVDGKVVFRGNVHGWAIVRVNGVRALLQLTEVVRLTSTTAEVAMEYLRLKQQRKDMMTWKSVIAGSAEDVAEGKEMLKCMVPLWVSDCGYREIVWAAPPKWQMPELLRERIERTERCAI